MHKAYRNRPITYKRISVLANHAILLNVPMQRLKTSSNLPKQNMLEWSG